MRSQTERKALVEKVAALEQRLREGGDVNRKSAPVQVRNSSVFRRDARREQRESRERERERERREGKQTERREKQ